MSSNFTIGKTYNFDVYPVTVLGNNFKNVTVLAILDRDTANQFVETQPMHINVYPYLPAGTPNNPGAYNWLKLRLASGQNTVIGIPWIVDNTVVEVTSKTAKVVIEGVSADDLPKIRNALSSNGFKNFTVDLV